MGKTYSLTKNCEAGTRGGEVNWGHTGDGSICWTAINTIPIYFCKLQYGQRGHHEKESDFEIFGNIFRK